jgi:ketosteroid isomerase-like protein
VGLSSFERPVGYEVRDLSITAGDEVAFCHSLNRVTGTTIGGKKIDMSWRATLCCRKIDGKWMVTHEHSSVPFDMESGKASLDLKL